jgi:hypothetical protein
MQAFQAVILASAATLLGGCVVAPPVRAPYYEAGVPTYASPYYYGPTYPYYYPPAYYYYGGWRARPWHGGGTWHGGASHRGGHHH